MFIQKKNTKKGVIIKYIFDDAKDYTEFLNTLTELSSRLTSALQRSQKTFWKSLWNIIRQKTLIANTSVPLWCSKTIYSR